MLEINKIYLGDCLIESEKIESGSVDLILTDLPYGTINGLGGDIKKYERLSKSYWDVTINTEKIYDIANRILRKNGKMILFCQEPYTTELINKAIPNLPFNIKMIWEKDLFANCLMCNKAPVNYYEEILIFSKKESYTEVNPLKEIMLKYTEKYKKEYIIELFKKEGRYTSDLSARVHASYKFGFNNGMRFDLMNKKMYDFLNNYIEFNESYEELKKINDNFKKETESIFNLWEGNKYKSNILKYKKDYNGYHPTQKPVLLLEDLIKTFSNEDDLVVDLTCGSGSTCVASINTNRNYIGFELDENYFNIANERIKNHKVGD